MRYAVLLDSCIGPQTLSFIHTSSAFSLGNASYLSFAFGNIALHFPDVPFFNIWGTIIFPASVLQILQKSDGLLQRLWEFKSQAPKLLGFGDCKHYKSRPVHAEQWIESF